MLSKLALHRSSLIHPAIHLGLTQTTRSLSLFPFHLSEKPNISKPRVGVVIGCFQPPHKEHANLLTDVITKHGVDNVLIVLGSSQDNANREKNPFSPLQCANMLRRMVELPLITPDQQNGRYGPIYPGKHSNFTFHLDASGNKNALAETVTSALKERSLTTSDCVVYYVDKQEDHGKYTKGNTHYLEQSGLPIEALPLVSTHDKDVLSSTFIREKLRTDGCASIEPYVHPMVFSYIRLLMAAAFIAKKPIHEVNSKEEESLLGSASRMLHKYRGAHFTITESGTVEPTPATRILTSREKVVSFPQKSEKGRKIAIAGMGWSGLATLQAIMSNGVLRAGDHLVGVERTQKHAKGVWDDFNALNIDKDIIFIPAGIDQPKALEGTDIVFVLTSGPLPAGPVKSRNWGLEANLPIATKLADSLLEYAPQAMVIIGSNPVEPLCAEFIRKGIPPKQVIGKTGIDTERFRRYLCDTIFRKHPAWHHEQKISHHTIFTSLTALQERCCMVGMHEASYMLPVIDMDAEICGRKMSILLTSTDIEICARAAMYEGLARTNQLRSPSIGAGLYNAQYAMAALNGGDVFASTMMAPEYLEHLLQDNPVLMESVQNSKMPVFHSTRLGLAGCQVQTIHYPDPNHILLVGRPAAKGITYQTGMWNGVILPAAEKSKAQTTVSEAHISSSVKEEIAKR